MNNLKTVFISKKDLKYKSVYHLLLSMHLNSNITPLKSVVFNKKLDRNILEKGLKIDFFDINDKDLINFWLSCRALTGIHCFYLETPNFKGCITQYKPYLYQCNEKGIRALRCSMYDD